MAFTFFLLAFATLAAFSQASLRYGSGVLSPVVDRRDYHRGVVVDPHAGSGRAYNKYDSGHVLNEYAYGSSRLNTGLRRAGSVGIVGDVSHFPHSHLCRNCQVGEVCRETAAGRFYCESSSGVPSVIGVHDHGIHSHGSGLHHNLGGSRACAYLEYPNDCVRSPRLGSRYTVTRYAFSHGRCQPFTSSRISRYCRPTGQANNVFASKYQCERYCLH